MIRPWELLGTRLLADHGIFRVREDRSLSPRTGKPHRLYVMESRDWVNVVPVTAEGRVVCVRQFRHGVRSVALEVPGGIVDPRETPEEAARRELFEETGYAGGDIVRIGTMNPNPAIQNNRCHIFLATGVQREMSQSLDQGEDIEVILINEHDIPGLIADGAIDNGIMVAALHYFHLHRVGPS